jgi:hypothetical protein
MSRRVNKIPDFNTAEERNLNIGLIAKIQEKFDHAILCGSAALFLQGVRLKRFSDTASDIDLILTQWELLEIDGKQPQPSKDLPSGCDFSEQVLVDGVKVDVQVNPYAQYEYINYKSFMFKVQPFMETIRAKARYNSEKHVNDFKELLINVGEKEEGSK